MAVSNVERIMARRQINRMIEDDRVTVTFTRRERLSAPGGGWRWGNPRTLDPQEAGLIPFKRRMSDFVINTELGQVIDGAYVLLGRHDFDVKREDTFELNGERFRVKQVDVKTEIRVSAIIDYDGGPLNA